MKSLHFYMEFSALNSLLELPSLFLIGLDMLCFNFHSILKGFTFLLGSSLDPIFSGELFSFHDFVYFFAVSVGIDIQP